MREKLKAINLTHLLLLSAFPSVTLFIFAPLEILSGIWADVWFDVSHEAGLMLLAFAVCFAVIFGAGVICGIVFPKFKIWYEALVVGVTLALYIQGNFMKSDFGSLDGSAVDWSLYRTDSLLSVAMWLVILASVFFLVWRMRKDEQKLTQITKYLMSFILLIQLVTLVTLSFTTDMLHIKDNAEYSTENEFTYSPNDNMIILVLDAYDSQIFNAVLEQPEGVDYDALFENFTYYPNTVSAFSRTYYAIPQMLTGVSYKNVGDYDEYLNEAYGNSPLFNELVKKDYSINLYTNEGFPTDEDVYGRIENYIPAGTNRMQISSKSRMLSYLVKLIGIRYLPVPLKQYCWFYGGDLYDVRQLEGHTEVYSVDNHNFLWDSEDMTTEATRNTFHFYHVEGVHSPYCFDRNFNKTGKEAFDRESMLEAGRGILVMVKEYFEELKALGIYDDSVIVIMADHGGAWVPDEGDYLRRHNPLLLVKGKGESHEFTVSQAPLSYEDLQDAYIRLLNGAVGDEVFTVKEGEDRERFYINDTDFTEYATKGHAFDYEAMQPTGVKYGE